MKTIAVLQVDVEIYGGDIAVIRTSLHLNAPFHCRPSSLTVDKITKTTPITGQIALYLDVSFSYIKFGEQLLMRTYVKPSINSLESSYIVYETETFGKRINDNMKKQLITNDGQDKLLSAIMRELNKYNWQHMQENFKYTAILVDRLINSQ